MDHEPERPDWETRIRDVFLNAAEMEPAGRAEYLAQACNGNPEVRAGVERLLAAFDNTRGLFAGTVPGAFLFDRTARQTFSPGDKVGRFTIGRLLGTGGMGEVYEVAEAELGGQFALKTLRREYALRADLAARFKREIQLARRVTHANVCRIYDVGFHETQAGTICYLTMEMLSGETLAERLRKGPLDPASVLTILKQVVAGVSALHAAGVVHRDVKPANVIIVASGEGERAVLTDFGIAHSLSEMQEEDLTINGQLMGTVKYMAPEQFTARKVGPEADVYALGIMMYESIRGYQPGETSTWHERVNRDLVESRRSGRSRKEELRLLDIALRCLEADPKIRFANAGEILTWLERVESAGASGRRTRWALGRNQPSGRISSRVLPAFRQFRIPISVALALGASLGAWPMLRVAALQRACLAAPGNRFVCQLPAERDMAVLPFRIVAGSEEDTALARGYGQFIRGALGRLYPDPDKHCLHLRNDQSGDGVRLVLEGEIRPRGSDIEFAFTVRDTWANNGAPTVLRNIRMTLPLSSTEQLYEEPLRLLSDALQFDAEPPAWKAWIKRRPQNAPAFTSYLRSLGDLQAGRYLQAITEANQTVDPAGEFAFAPGHAALAQAYRLLSNRTKDASLAVKARESAERALGLDSEFDFGLAERELGDTEAGLGRQDEAIRHYSAALRSWPFDEASVKGLAVAYEAAGRISDAERTFQKAVEAAPRCWLTRNALADFYSRNNRYADAERSLLEAIRYTPRNSVLYHNLAFDYIKRGRYDDAIQMASKSIELNPVPLSFSTLGRAYLYKNCQEAALLNLRHAISLDKDYYILWANLAEALTTRNRNAAESRQAFTRVVELSDDLLQKTPTHVRARLQRALNLARLDRSDEAVAEIERLLQKSRSGEVLFGAAQTYELADRRNEALAVLGQAFDAGLSVFQAQAAADLKLLRSDSRYASLLMRHGVAARGGEAGHEAAPPQSCPGATAPGKGL